MAGKRSNYLVAIRRLAQSASVLFFIYIVWAAKYPLKGFVNPAAVFWFDPLAMAVTAIAGRVLLAGLLYAAATLVLTFIFGRFFCGWVCPLGGLLDLWSYALRKIVRRKYSERAPSAFRHIKYVQLALLIVLALFGLQLAWLFDPITIFVRTFSYNVLPAINNGVEQAFGFALQKMGFPEWLDRAYQALKENALNLSGSAYPHTWPIFAVAVVVFALAVIKPRLWCRYFCPLGGMLAFVSKFTPFRRRVSACTNCAACRNACRMNAIKPDNSYLPDECALCLECVIRCPGKTAFSFSKGRESAGHTDAKGITRRQFLFSLGSAATACVLATPKKLLGSGSNAPRPVIRPPGARPEDEFVRRCIRCGNCIKICITNGLQPALLESGWQGVWTPRMDTAIGYCEHRCNLCGQVCPTGAIKNLTLEQKIITKLGTANVLRQICIPWTTGEGCLVCEEQCPIPEKAVKREKRVVNQRPVEVPVVDRRLCVGCAICENKCPVRPRRAITVTPL
ncbi:MAG: 4Fe-4S binding protein [Candidatus Edwardsbacteria bacterium]|nr:4Fe-4S binding protein [Candidatus Edwardsbacteria bacterium]